MATLVYSERRLRRTTSSPVLFPISPCVTSAILHDHVTALEVNGVAVIEFKPNLALEGYGVKPWFSLLVIQQVRNGFSILEHR